MKSQKILLIEDSFDMQLLVRSILKEASKLTCASTLESAKEHINKGYFTLVLLDVDLPDGSGFQFCEYLRKQNRFNSVPIIFLAEQTDTEHKVLGFDLGADDYLIKPPEPREFLARVGSKIKRKRDQVASQNTIVQSNLRLDLTKQAAFTLDPHGQEVELKLTPTEFKLLVHFLRSEGSILSRSSLQSAVWGESVHISGHTIDTHISSLRKKVALSGHQIRAVVKEGYCFFSPTKPKRVLGS